MKKIIIIISVLFLFSPLQAQIISGSFKDLKARSRVQFDVDFSEAYIHGLPEDEFADLEQDWNKDKPDVVACIINEFNDNSAIIRVGHYKDTEYSLKLIIRSISSKGDFDSDLYLYDADGNQIGSIEGIWGKGGRFGSKLNLIKDGAESTGKELAVVLLGAMKKGKTAR